MSNVGSSHGTNTTIVRNLTGRTIRLHWWPTGSGFGINLGPYGIITFAGNIFEALCANTTMLARLRSDINNGLVFVTGCGSTSARTTYSALAGQKAQYNCDDITIPPNEDECPTLPSDEDCPECEESSCEECPDCPECDTCGEYNTNAFVLETPTAPEYRLGPADAEFASLTYNLSIYGGTTEQRLIRYLNWLPFSGGDLNLDAFKFKFRESRVDLSIATYFVIYSLPAGTPLIKGSAGSTLNVTLEYSAVLDAATSDLVDGTTYTYSIDDAITLPDGKWFYWGVAVAKAASSAAYAGAYTGGGNVDTNIGSGIFWVDDSSVPATTIIDGDNSAHTTTVQHGMAAMQLTFSTYENILWRVTGDQLPASLMQAQNRYNYLRPVVPVKTNGGYLHYGFTGFAGANSNTNVINKFSYAGATATDELYFCKNSNDGTVNIGFGLNSGVGVTDGHLYTDEFIFDIQIDFTNNEAELFYCDETNGQGGLGVTDKALFAHGTQRAGLRNSLVSLGSVTYSFMVLPTPSTRSFSLRETTPLGTWTIATETGIVFGDSQASNASDARLGYYLPALLGVPGINLAVGGNNLSRNSTTGGHTAGYLRYNSSVGDVCEIRSALLVIAGIGTNDIGVVVSTGGPDKTLKATQMTRLFASICGDWLGRYSYNHTIATFATTYASDRKLLIIGIPPSDVAISYAALREECIQLFNRGLRAVAEATRCVFYDPYAYVLENIDTFIENGGVHYVAAGASAVATAAANAYLANPQVTKLCMSETL